MYNKRSLNHFTEEDDEEEDEWEREASVSSASKKPAQPNKYAVQIDILDDQYKLLCDTRVELTKELKQLQATLQELDREEQDLTTSVKISNQEYLDSIDETLALILNSTEQFDDPVQVNYLSSDALLSKELESIIEEWQAMLIAGDNYEDADKQIKSLAHSYRYTEFEVLDLIAQITGLEARIQSLERETSKLNSLPQMIPILRSETERYQQEMRTATNILGSMEQDSIRPHLIRLSELKITQPLYEDKYIYEQRLFSDVVNEFGELYKIALRQRSCQQLVEYVDIKINDSSNATILKSFTTTLEDQLESLIVVNTKEKEADSNSSDNVHTAKINNLLDEFFRSKKDITLFTTKIQDDMTLSDQIDLLKEYEMKLKKKWQTDFQSCLDAAEILDGLKHRLSQTLYRHSNSTDRLIMTPKPYSNLQSELEFRTNELEVSISNLEKKIGNPNENLIFTKLKQLFSLFYTDPNAFLAEFQKVKSEINESFSFD